MDINDFLKNGTVIKNPNYKKATKKNPGSPKIIVSNDINNATDYGSKVGQTLAANSYDLTHLQNDKNKYADYDVRINPVNTQEELNTQRAKNQSVKEQLGNFLVQAVGNEVVLGTVLGLSNLADAGVNAMSKESGENDYTNPFSMYLEEKQNAIREKYEIYRNDPNSTWAVNDFGWWADNSVSIASTASMLIPSTGVAKGLSLAGKLAKLDRVTMGLAKAAKTAKLTENAASLAKTINVGAEIGTTALLSRTMEGYQEARGVYTEVYDKSLDRVKNLTIADKQKMIENNPDFEGLSDEEMASRIAGKSADETFKNDYAMLIFDVAQFKALGSIWKGVTNKTATSTIKAAQRKALGELVEKEGDDVAKALGFFGRKKEAIADAFHNPLNSLAAVEISEGFEEMYQGIQTEKGKEVAETIFNPAYSTRTLSSYLSDGAIWEQGFWGILGGVGFQAAGSALGNLAKKVKGQYNKKTMTDEEFALSQLSDEKIRENEINSRKANMQNYVEQMQLLNENKNPGSFVIDPLTGKDKIVDGSKVHQPITQEEADDLKTRTTNEFVTNMVLNATDTGNYELFKEFVSDKRFDEFFKQAGINADGKESNFSNNILRKMDEVYESYTGALYDVINSIDVESNAATRATARNIARTKLETYDLQNRIDELSANINRDSEGFDTSHYEAFEHTKFVKKQIDELNAQMKKIEEAYANKQISEQALKEYTKEYDKRYNQIKASDSFKDSTLDGLVGKIDGLDVFLDNLEANAPKTLREDYTPKKSLQDAIKKKIALEDKRDLYASLIPNTQKEFKEAYDGIALGMDAMTVKRYTEAVDKVNAYVEAQDDLTKAREDILTNNVPDDLRPSLDILKLGHTSTIAYLDGVNALFSQVVKDRVAKEEEARQVKLNEEKLNAEKAAQLKAELDAVTAQTEKETSAETISDESKAGTSSTGKVEQSKVEEVIDPNQVVTNVEEDIKNIDKVTDTIEQQRAEEFILDIDSRASGLASSITFNLYKTSKSLFNNVIGKDVKSEEFNRLVDTVADELINQGVSRGLAREAAIKGIKLALNPIARRLKGKDNDAAESFKTLAEQLANKHSIEVDGDDVNNAVTKLIPDDQLNEVIDSFIQSYISNRGIVTPKGSKVIINIEDLFKELISNPDISYEQAKHVFYNIHDYVNSPNKNYVFTNRTELNKNIKTPSVFFNNLINAKSTRESIDTYMHMSVPSKIDSNYTTVANEALRGAPVTISYYRGEFGTSKNSISVQRSGIEIGYLGSVIPNSTNTGYRLAKQNQGFVYDLNDDGTGIVSNLDKLFIPVINRENDKASRLMDLAYNQYLYEIALNNDQSSDSISIDDSKEVLNNPIIKELIYKGELKIPNNKTTERQKAQYILNMMNNVIFYDNNAVTADQMSDSYEYWKASTFNNYANTHKIQQALNANQTIETKLVKVDSGKVLISNKNTNIGELGFTFQNNPIMIVNTDGTIVSENSNTSYTNVAGFQQGTMGVLIADNQNAPIMALFTESNPLSSNIGLANRTYNELVDLFTKFQNNELSFDRLGKHLSDLFSGPGAKSNNLFSGYSVIQTGDKIALNIKGRKGEYSVIVHKFEKGTNREGTGITHIPNGDKTKAKSSITTNNAFIKNIAKEIVDNLSFNKTFYGVNNKNVDNDSTNEYIQKRNGKLIVNIGGKEDVYESFGHFALSNNAFKTNQGVNKDGTYFDNSDRLKSLFINVESINSPVEKYEAEQVNTTATDLIKTATKDSGVSTSELLTKAGIEKGIADVITGSNEFNIALIPDTVFYDDKATKTLAYYTKGKVFFSKTGATSIGKSPKNLIRLLMHEHIHATVDKHDTFSKDGIVTDLLNTYQAFVQEVENDYHTQDKQSQRYKDALILRNWIESNKFTPTEYFAKLSAEQQRYWSEQSQEERDRHFAEEWLVESISQPFILNYLNNTNYTGEDISIEGIDNNAKTIWQKLIDVLLKIFGKNTDNVKNNSILAKQYSILGTSSDIVTVNDDKTITDNEKTNDVPKEPISTDTVNEQTIIKEKAYSENNAINRDAPKKRERRERDAVTSTIEEGFTVDEAVIDSYRNSNNTNTNGVVVIDNMNNYVKMFAEQDKPIIANLMASNGLKFVCQ